MSANTYTVHIKQVCTTPVPMEPHTNGSSALSVDGQIIVLPSLKPYDHQLCTPLTEYDFP